MTAAPPSDGIREAELERLVALMRREGVPAVLDQAAADIARLRREVKLLADALTPYAALARLSSGPPGGGAGG